MKKAKKQEKHGIELHTAYLLEDGTLIQQSGTFINATTNLDGNFLHIFDAEDRVVINIEKCAYFVVTHYYMKDVNKYPLKYYSNILLNNGKVIIESFCDQICILNETDLLSYDDTENLIEEYISKEDQEFIWINSKYVLEVDRHKNAEDE